MTIQAVPVDGNTNCTSRWREGLCPFTIRGHQEQCVQMIQCVCRGNDGWRPDFLRRKNHPWRTAMHRKRGSLRHPCGSRSAVFVNSAHWVSTSVNIHKCQGYVTLSMCQRHATFSSARGTNFHLRIMRPHHQCLNCTSQVWLVLLLLLQPHSWLELGHHISIPLAIHCI